MDWYLDIVKQYADFSGRSSRREYWQFFFATMGISLALSLVEGAAGGPGVIALVFNLIVLIPAIAIGVRRQHDTDRSGWWLLVPVAGIVFLCLKGQTSANRFGDVPGGEDSARVIQGVVTREPDAPTNPVLLSENMPVHLDKAKQAAGNALKRAIGSLPDDYYVTNLAIGALFPIAILAAGQAGMTPKFMILATLSTLAYPFSRYFYEKNAHLIPMDQAIFFKIVAAICCWGLAVFIGPFGLMYALNESKKKSAQQPE